GLVVLQVTVIDQRVEAINRFDDHVAAAPAIAAIRSAERNELLAPERDAAIAARAGSNEDLALVEKLHRVAPFFAGAFLATVFFVAVLALRSFRMSGRPGLRSITVV